MHDDRMRELYWSKVQATPPPFESNCRHYAHEASGAIDANSHSKVEVSVVEREQGFVAFDTHYLEDIAGRSRDTHQWHKQLTNSHCSDDPARHRCSGEESGCPHRRIRRCRRRQQANRHVGVIGRRNVSKG